MENFYLILLIGVVANCLSVSVLNLIQPLTLNRFELSGFLIMMAIPYLLFAIICLASIVEIAVVIAKHNEKCTENFSQELQETDTIQEGEKRNCHVCLFCGKKINGEDYSCSPISEKENHRCCEECHRNVIGHEKNRIKTNTIELEKGNYSTSSVKETTSTESKIIRQKESISPKNKFTKRISANSHDIDKWFPLLQNKKVSLFETELLISDRWAAFWFIDHLYDIAQLEKGAKFNGNMDVLYPENVCITAKDVKVRVEEMLDFLMLR